MTVFGTGGLTDMIGSDSRTKELGVIKYRHCHFSKKMRSKR